LVVFLSLFAFPALARADALDDQVREIAKGLRCPVCSGETVADSHAPISIQMRGIIREKLEAGESKDQIDAYFVSRYGPEILLTPQASGFTLGVWIMPIVALIVGFVIVLAVLRSWSRRGDAPTTPAEDVAPAPVEQIPAGDDARLEQELARFRHGPKAGGGVPG
jgi:cytochrome c-type biogenesis protein CcmH